MQVELKSRKDGRRAAGTCAVPTEEGIRPLRNVPCVLVAQEVLDSLSSRSIRFLVPTIARVQALMRSGKANAKANLKTVRNAPWLLVAKEAKAVGFVLKMNDAKRWNTTSGIDGRGSQVSSVVWVC